MNILPFVGAVEVFLAIYYNLPEPIRLFINMAPVFLVLPTFFKILDNS